MVDIYFSSDLHLDHWNMLHKFKQDCPGCLGRGIVEYTRCQECNGDGEIPMRPFHDLNEMHREIVERHNKVVRPQDHWYFLGDLTMHRKIKNVDAILSQMNGHKRILLGNHDADKTGAYYERFEKVLASARIADVIFTHYPIHPDSIGRALGNAHGHVHTNGSPQGRYLNLCVEAIDYTPVHLDWVVKKLKEKN